MSKLLFEYLELATMLLECLIAVDTLPLEAISSRRSILSCERLYFVSIPFWIFLYEFLIVLHHRPNDGLGTNL
jgi:hypothetical protein